MKRTDILGYFNDYYYSALGIYKDHQKYGMPWGGLGYMEIPEYLKTIYDLFDVTLEQFKQYQSKKARKK